MLKIILERGKKKVYDPFKRFKFRKIRFDLAIVTAIKKNLTISVISKCKL